MRIDCERWGLPSGVVLLLVATQLAGCGVSRAPRHEYTLLPGRAFDGRQKTVLVLPINETMELPSGLEKGQALVSELLRTYLEEKGLEVIEVERRAFRKALDAAAVRADREMLSGQSRSVAREVGFDRVAPFLVAELGVDPDLVVVPNMMMRTAELSGSRTVRWDGVRRRMPGAHLESLTGTNPAASLWVTVYDDEGGQVFSGFGGLDLLYEINLQRKRSELIENRLEDAKHLAEGVCVAFHPFFGEDESC